MQNIFPHLSWGVFLNDGKKLVQLDSKNQGEVPLFPNPQAYFNFVELAKACSDVQEKNPLFLELVSPNVDKLYPNTGVIWVTLQKSADSEEPSLIFSWLKPWLKPILWSPDSPYSKQNACVDPNFYGAYINFKGKGLEDDLPGMVLQFLERIVTNVEQNLLKKFTASTYVSFSEDHPNFESSDKFSELKKEILTNIYTPEFLGLAKQIANLQESGSQTSISAPKNSSAKGAEQTLNTLVIEDVYPNLETAETSNREQQLKIVINNLFTYELYQQFPQIVIPLSDEVLKVIPKFVKAKIDSQEIFTKVTKVSLQDNQDANKQIHNNIEHANPEVLDYFRTRKYQRLKVELSSSISHLEKLNLEIEARTEVIDRLKKKVAELNNKASLDNNQDQSKDQSKDQHQDQHANPATSVAQRSSELESELASLRAQLDESEEARKSLLQEREHTIDNHHKLMDAIRDLGTQLKDQSQKFTELKAEHDQLLEDSTTLKYQLQTSYKENTQLKEKIAELRSQAFTESSSELHPEHRQATEDSSGDDANRNTDKTDAELLAEARKALEFLENEHRITSRVQQEIARERDQLKRLLISPPLLMLRQERIFDAGVNIFTLGNSNRQNQQFEFVVYECLLSNGKWTYQPPMGTVSASGQKLSSNQQYKMSRTDVYELKNGLRADEKIYEFTWLNQASTNPDTFMSELMKKFDEEYPDTTASKGTKSSPPSRIYVILAIADIDGDDPIYPGKIKSLITPDKISGFKWGAGIVFAVWVMSWIMGLFGGNKENQSVVQVVPVYQVSPSTTTTPATTPTTQPSTKPTSQPSVRPPTQPIPQPSPQPPKDPSKPELDPL